jgi:hypothetical protein
VSNIRSVVAVVAIVELLDGDFTGGVKCPDSGEFTRRSFDRGRSWNGNPGNGPKRRGSSPPAVLSVDGREKKYPARALPSGLLPPFVFSKVTERLKTALR